MSHFLPIIIWNCLWFEGNCYLLVFESHNQLNIGQWNFCFRTYSYILVHGFGLGLGLGFTETFWFGFGFCQNPKIGFVWSLMWHVLSLLMLLLYIYRCTCKEIHIRKESICNRMESVMKAVLLTRTVVRLGFFIDISFDF